MNYREEIKQSERYKKNYLDGLETLIKFREQQSETKRAEYVKQIFETPENYREDFKKNVRLILRRIQYLIYPIRLCIEIGEKDDLFDCHYGLEAYEKAKKMCNSVGTDWLNLVVYDGIHEFCKEDAPIEQMVKDLKNNTYEVTK